MEDWLSKKEIIFEPPAPYSQDHNGVSKCINKTIMDITQLTIREKNLDNNLWSKVILAMTSVKNIQPTRALNRKILTTFSITTIQASSIYGY